MLRHMAGVAEIVEDFGSALAFYRDVLGLEVEKQDGDDYAELKVPGIAHFGIWNRAHAALCMFGSREQANRVPPGFTLEFEADNLQRAAAEIDAAGYTVDQAPREEPWGQKTFRMLGPGGGVLGFAETPWARRVRQQVETAADPDDGS